MIYLLDADIVNYLLKAISPVPQRFMAATAQGASFVLSSTVHYQVTRYLRLIRATRVQQFYAEMVRDWARVAFVFEDWDTAADLWAQRHREGKPIQDADLLIAVAALKSGACLVTNNTRHFEDLGLRLENWAAP